MDVRHLNCGHLKHIQTEEVVHYVLHEELGLGKPLREMISGSVLSKKQM